MIVPPMVPESQIELPDSTLYRITHVVVGQPSETWIAGMDEMNASIRGERIRLGVLASMDNDGGEVAHPNKDEMTMHYLYIFYEEKIPKTTAELIYELEDRIVELDKELKEAKKKK